MENRITRNTAEIMRDEMVMKDKITALLKDGPKTIPEIAQALGHPGHEVLIWVMAMWRYGTIAEAGKEDDGYYKYQLV